MTRTLTVSWLAVVAAIVIIAGLYAEQRHPGALLAAPLLFGGGFVVIAACMGKPWALKLFLFVLIVLINMAFRQQRDATDLSVDGSILYRITLWSIALVIGLANLPASVRYFQNASYLSLLAYILLAATSALYSLAPTYTAGCAYGNFCMLVFVAAVVARLEVKEVLQVAVLAVGTHVFFAVLLWFVYPSRVTWTNWAGGEKRLGGFLGHPYPMAQAAALFLLAGWIMWRERWLSNMAFAFVGTVGGLALFLTQTRSAILAVALALMSSGRFRPASTTLVVAVFLGGAVAVCAIPEALDTIALQFSRGDNAEGTLTLTGRTHIWAESLRLFEERPLLGYGFAATRTLFREGENFTTRNTKGEAPPHAHNMIVQSLVTTGIIGTLLLLVPLVIPLIHSLRHRDGLANPLTWYIAIVGLASVGPIGTAPGMVTIFWTLSLLMIEVSRSGALNSEGAERQDLGHRGLDRVHVSLSR